ncbi:MAG: hypothetical protein ACXADH_06695 [Candidatus Kariarchaeaceae archaeon]|jgi:hypothetical protein
MTITYERQWLSGNPAHTYQWEFIEFNDKLAVYTLGPNANEGQIIDSSDGAVWANLLTIDPLVAGISNQDLFSGFLAIYQDNLWISQKANIATDTRVLEWDGTSLTQHLNSVSQNNEFSYSLITWDSKLWLVTDQTPAIANDRRVVYFYNGTSWTAIIDYDGTAYLDYNNNTPPIDASKQRRTSLFVYLNQLYLFASRYDTVTAKWGWQIWQFDSANYDNFTLIYEQYDEYALSAVLLYKGELVVTANKIGAGGNPTIAARIYTANSLTSWTTLGTYDTLGMIWWVSEINNKMFLNTHDLNVTNRVNIRSLDPWLGDPVLDGTITTNAIAGSDGGLYVFNDELYVGKWKEIYKRVSDEVETVPVEPPSIVIIEIPFMDKNLSPIDIITPNKFFDGRLLSVPSTNRSLDDRTGLPSVGDLTVTIANHDKEVSKWLHDYPVWKGNIVIAWIVRPGTSLSARLAYFKYVIIDHWREGPNVVMLLRDVLRKYFDREVPEDVCT